MTQTVVKPIFLLLKFATMQWLKERLPLSGLVNYAGGKVGKGLNLLVNSDQGVA